jgi:hypothetical protein
VFICKHFPFLREKTYTYINSLSLSVSQSGHGRELGTDWAGIGYGLGTGTGATGHGLGTGTGGLGPGEGHDTGGLGTVGLCLNVTDTGGLGTGRHGTGGLGTGWARAWASWARSDCVWTSRVPTSIFINKDENPFTKSTRHVDANVNTWKKNQDHQNSSNEVKGVMLKGHPKPQIS